MTQTERLNQYMAEVFDAKKPFVFISYSHEQKDVEKVYPLLDELMRAGINFAIDTEYPGKDKNWIPQMFARVSNPNWKAMLSFFSKTYMYSRPSLLEQFVRYAQVVKNKHQNEIVPCIYISLFNGTDIRFFLDYEDKVTPKEIKQKMIDRMRAKLEEGGLPPEDEAVLKSVKKKYQISGDMKDYLQTGLKGFYDNDKVSVENALKELGDVSASEVETMVIEEVIENVRLRFLEIGDREQKWSNVNTHKEVEHIFSMMAERGVKKDAVIAEKASKLFEEAQPEEENTQQVRDVQPMKEENCSEKEQSEATGEQRTAEYSEKSVTAAEHSRMPEVVKEPLKMPQGMVAAATTFQSVSEAAEKEIQGAPKKGKLWKYIGSSAEAYLEWDGEDGTGCIVRKGSKLGNKAEKFEKNVPGAAKLKRELEERGIIVDGVFQEDFPYDRVPKMINLLDQGSVDCPKAIRTGKLFVVSNESVAETGTKRSVEIAQEKGTLVENTSTEKVLTGSFNQEVSDTQSLPKEALQTEGLSAGEKDVAVENEQVQSSKAVAVWRYIRKEKGTDAYIEWAGGESKACVVRKGSRVGNKAAKFEENVPGAAKLMRELEAKGIIVDNVFQEDYAYDKISTMVKMLGAGSVDFPGAIKSGAISLVSGEASVPEKAALEGNASVTGQSVKQQTSSGQKKSSSQRSAMGLGELLEES